MNIIANINVNVNTEKSGNKRSEFVQTEKWRTHREEAQRVAEKMHIISEGRAQRMKECGTLLDVVYCNDCDSYSVRSANLCRDRFCPVCNWRLSLQRYVNMNTLFTELYMAYPDIVVSFVTLTVKSCKVDELSTTMDRMSKAWHNLLCRRPLKRIIKGTAKSVEVTYNEKTKEFHPHYHILIAWESPDKRIAETNSKEFIANWLSCCLKNNLVANIKAQNAKSVFGEVIDFNGEQKPSMARAVAEVFKYAFKSKQLDDMPLTIFRKFAQEFSGKRLVSFTGIIAEYAKVMKIDTEKVDADETITICNHCGSVNLDKMLYEWSFGESAYIRKD